MQHDVAYDAVLIMLQSLLVLKWMVHMQWLVVEWLHQMLLLKFGYREDAGLSIGGEPR